MSEEAAVPKTLWEVDSTHAELGQKIRAGLREIKDPELGLNVIELGLVREVRIEDSTVRVRMILTTPFCPYGPALLDQTRVQVEQMAEMDATIELGMEPWHPQLMEDGAAADWGFF